MKPVGGVPFCGRRIEGRATVAGNLRCAALQSACFIAALQRNGFARTGGRHQTTFCFSYQNRHDRLHRSAYGR